MLRRVEWRSQQEHEAGVVESEVLVQRLHRLRCAVRHTRITAVFARLWLRDRRPAPRHATGPERTLRLRVRSPAFNAGWRMEFTGLLCKQPPYGGTRAIDLATGRTLWDRPLGTARKNGPFGIPSHLPFRIGTPNNGGPIVTAGGLVSLTGGRFGVLYPPTMICCTPSYALFLASSSSRLQNSVLPMPLAEQST